MIGLLAVIVGMGVPAFNSAFRTSKDSFARQMALLLREARDRAMLNDKLIRLRIDFEKQEYWLEEAPSNYMLQKPVETSMSEREKEERGKKEEGSFRQLKELTATKVEIPKGLKIIEVSSARYKKPVTEGDASVYFFNNGSTDGATIHFQDEESVRQRITLHPVTGHSRLELGAGEAAR